MLPFHPSFEALFRNGPPAPEDYERYLASLGFPEIAGRPGWFQMPPGWHRELGGQPISTGQVIHFTLFDPDKKALPFHRSTDFVVHPAEFRMECLFRNPQCANLSACLFECARALASHQPPQGELLRFVQLQFDLEDQFGLSWTLPFGNGDLLGLPQPVLSPAYPNAPLYGGPTVRGRRTFTKALAAKRRHHGMKAPRQLSGEEYRRLLNVWDAREGWEGPLRGYDPERAVTLPTAAAQTGTRPATYYEAFRFIAGRRYSVEGWLAIIGPAWVKWRESGLFKRRGTGRKQGVDSEDPLDRLLRLFDSPDGGELPRRLQTCEDPVQVAINLEGLPERDRVYLIELLSSCASSGILRTLFDHLTDLSSPTRRTP